MKLKYLSLVSFLILVCCVVAQGRYEKRMKLSGTIKASPGAIEYETVSETNGTLDVLFVEEEYLSGIDVLFADGHKSISDEMYSTRYRYAENTPEGVRMVDINSNYTSGRLFYTVKSARLAMNINEMDVPLTGFSREARLYKNEENKWIEGKQPKWIKEDGTFEKGKYLILVDLILESDNAAMVTDDEPNSRYYSDPYLFRLDGLLSLFDMNRPSRFAMMDYFDKMSLDPENEFVIYLQPGERTTCTIGFIVEDTWLSNPSDFSQLTLCNTQGVKDSVYINLGLELY